MQQRGRATGHYRTMPMWPHSSFNNNVIASWQQSMVRKSRHFGAHCNIRQKGGCRRFDSAALWQITAESGMQACRQPRPESPSFWCGDGS